MNTITMYSTQWCRDCHNAKRFLNEAGITYDEVNIDEDEQAAQQVIGWSGGRRVIPTFHILKDGSLIPVILHNPPLLQLALAIKGDERDVSD